MPSTHDRRRCHQWNWANSSQAASSRRHSPWRQNLVRGVPPDCGPPPETRGVCWRMRKSAVRASPALLTTGVSTTRDQTAELFVFHGLAVTLLKQFDRGSKERTAMQLKILVQWMLLPVVLSRLTYVSGGGGKSNWNSVRWFFSVHSSSKMVHSSSNMVPLSMKRLVLRKTKVSLDEEVSCAAVLPCMGHPLPSRAYARDQ